jgi:hypothetical protein
MRYSASAAIFVAALPPDVAAPAGKIAAVQLAVFVTVVLTPSSAMPRNVRYSVPDDNPVDASEPGSAPSLASVPVPSHETVVPAAFENPKPNSPLAVTDEDKFAVTVSLVVRPVDVTLAQSEATAPEAAPPWPLQNSSTLE